MNIKILGLPLAIVSCLSLNIASYAATNHQLASSNARISGILPKDGTYVVVAKTFQPGETGNYQIKVTVEQ